MGLLLGPPTAPDLLMSDDGRVLGLRDEKGVVRVASTASSADTWARRSGQDGAKRWLASVLVVPEVCAAKKKQWHCDKPTRNDLWR